MAKVMIVDDAVFMRKMLSDIITNAGHQVVGEAANGVEVMDCYTRNNPDVVFMDITMPEMDGLQALKLLKASHKDVKVVMCSAMGQESMVKEAIISGAKGFIVKPFQKDRIIEEIAKNFG